MHLIEKETMVPAVSCWSPMFAKLKKKMSSTCCLFDCGCNRKGKKFNMVFYQLNVDLLKSGKKELLKTLYPETTSFSIGAQHGWMTIDAIDPLALTLHQRRGALSDPLGLVCIFFFAQAISILCSSHKG